jgi:hypothetical protein
MCPRSPVVYLISLPYKAEGKSLVPGAREMGSGD